ncbi:MAG: GPW/gp25 family protein [Oscillospiraceae bacterium]
MDLSNISISFDEYSSGDEALRREVERNIKTVLSTPIGTCPLYRNFGISIEMLDTPTIVAQNMLTVAIIEAIEEWEPRVQVTDVTVDMGATVEGKMSAKVVVSIG